MADKAARISLRCAEMALGVRIAAPEASFGSSDEFGRDACPSNLPIILGLAHLLEAIVEFGMIHAYVRK